MYELPRLSLRQMTECGIVLRTLHRRAASVEDVCQLMVQHLYDEMRADRERACVLVRAYKTCPYDALDTELQVFAREVAGREPAPSTPCLTLLGTAGEESAWNSGHDSHEPRVMPLGSAAALERFPMIAQLVAQLGIEAHAIVCPDPDVVTDMQQRACNVFYIADARGNPHIPAQDFVQRYGVRSVVGFGSVLPPGDLFAVLLFTRTHLALETAQLFRPLALAAKLSLLQFAADRRFDADTLQGYPGLQAQLATLEQLMEVREHAVIAQSEKLELALTEAAERAQDADLARRRAEAASERAQFLADAGKKLTSSLDYEATLQHVAALAVPAFADWCCLDLLDLQEDGELKRVAVVHADPAQSALLRERSGRAPDAGVHQVVRTGLPDLIADVRAEIARPDAGDDAQRASSAALEERSRMIVPLQTRGMTLGALTLVLTGSDRRYDEADLELILELAARAAVAIDHARVLREHKRTQTHLEATAAELEAQTEELHSTVEELESTTQDLLEANEALAHAHAEAERARAIAEDANAAKSQFLATMSHELRTPLNAIDGYAELIELGVHGPVTEQQRRALGRLRRSQKRLLSLINDVLNFAKLEAGQVKFDARSVLVSDLIADLEMVITPQVIGKQLELVVEGIPPQLQVLADKDKAEQILLNLAANAVKFTAERGVIQITAASDAGRASIVVSDTGVGIPAHRLDSIFEPFVQVESGLGRDHAGVGLGLAISRDLARAMGGDLTVQSVLGRGSSFTLLLPLAEGGASIVVDTAQSVA